MFSPLRFAPFQSQTVRHFAWQGHVTRPVCTHAPVAGSDVRVRYAPSPTGHLHLGGLRTALFNFLFARKHGGQFIVRIEDTDQSRLVHGAAEELVQTLDWAGVRANESPQVGGAAGPYVQSQRLPVYREHVDQLLESRHAYRCFCSTDRLARLRKAQSKQGMTTNYDRACLHLSSDDVKARLADGLPSVVRFHVPDGDTTVHDGVRGHVSVHNKSIDDQILLKSDGFPTYHLAAVVDDHLMSISHVIRGEEWLPSTPKHVLLYEAFGWKAPEFWHLPLLLNADRTKVSKRTGDLSVQSLRQQGILAEALVNFVAHLGWSPSAGSSMDSGDKQQEVRAETRTGYCGIRWYNSFVFVRAGDLEYGRACGSVFSPTRPKRRCCGQHGQAAMVQ